MIEHCYASFLSLSGIITEGRQITTLVPSDYVKQIQVSSVSPLTANAQFLSNASFVKYN